MRIIIIIIIKNECHSNIIVDRLQVCAYSICAAIYQLTAHVLLLCSCQFLVQGIFHAEVVHSAMWVYDCWTLYIIVSDADGLSS